MTTNKIKRNYYAKSQVRNKQILGAAWDVETEGMGGKLLSMQYGISAHDVIFDSSPDMIKNFFDYIYDYPSPYIWYAHYAQYDWRYITQYMLDNNIKFDLLMRSDNDIFEIRLEYRGRRFTMRDSYALINCSLSKMAESFCPELAKLEIDIENFDVNNADHIKYGKRDVEILLTAIPRAIDLFRTHFGIIPNATTASTALKAWQNTLSEEERYYGRNFNYLDEFIRAGYYGGIVFLTDTNVQYDVSTYDVNSSYPSVMVDCGVPEGMTMRSRDYRQYPVGMYRVRIKSPDNLIIPIIPARDNRGNMRWFCGEFETVCTGTELLFAEKNGYKVLEVFEGISWETIVYPFNAFIEKCKKMRVEYKGKAEEFLAKLMQNSLYGKTGTRRERKKIIITRFCEDESILEGATPIDAEGEFYSITEFADDMLCKPEWAAFITANARLKLLSNAYAVGPENVLYGDTDSLTIKKGYDEKIDVGSEYGQFKKEKTWSEFRALGAKLYAGHNDKSGWSGAAKGLTQKELILKDGKLINANGGELEQLKNKRWQNILKNGSHEAFAHSLDSLKASLKNGVVSSTIRSRKSSDISNSCNFYLHENGKVGIKSAN